MKILLADDDPITLDALHACIEPEGFTALLARDGREALALWQAGRPDLLCLDIMMPHVDGYEVCRRVRAADPQVPVLFSLGEKRGDRRGRRPPTRRGRFHPQAFRQTRAARPHPRRAAPGALAQSARAVFHDARSHRASARTARRAGRYVHESFTATSRSCANASSPTRRRRR